MSRAKTPTQAPTAVIETTPPPDGSAPLDQWRTQVWAGKTYGAFGREEANTDIHPLIVQVWREDVMARLTDLSLAQWMKNQQ